jgi:hypothetical protein
MMAFKNSTISPPTIVDPARCRAEFLGTVESSPRRMTQQERDEYDAKQAAYAKKRAEWRNFIGVKDV